ncbi:adenylate/guanylate cyclase domain-containing protein [Seohaeicola saemankumensis]|nr:adenylate/guanylate cyclase domain-containing protein [Seohaeicola saemankumensis]MCA0872414.1 adenylate/guanylate cyclase domain-containing protein [Seohaeicola saemankumensis]
MTQTRRKDNIDALGRWITQQGVIGTPFDVLIESFCERLHGTGLQLLRVNFSMRAQHPSVGAFAYRWKRKTGLLHEEYVRDPSIHTGWDASPLKRLVESDDTELRLRLTPDHRPFAFPMLEDLVAQGGTDYFAQQLSFLDPARNVDAGPIDPQASALGLLVSWTTDAPGGFGPGDLDDLRSLLPALGLALKSNANYRMASDLLGAYLGADAGRRVLSGEILRGTTERISAVILMFDLSGFTRVSESLDSDAVIDLLNDYYGMVVEEIETRGGNVLKFMGDGLLAVFTAAEETEAGGMALDTVEAIRDGMAQINTARAADNRTVTGCTMALHAGDVAYGNIGGRNRLDFTVIGPAVNTTARLSGMCAHVDQPVVISARVARPHLGDRPALVSLGQYRLRGVAERHELYTLD